MPSRISSNWVAVLLSVFVFGLAQVLMLWRRGRREMLRQWKEGVAIGVAAVMAGWFLLFCGSLVTTVYDDHASLVAGNQALRKERTALTSERDEWKKKYEELSTKQNAADRRNTSPQLRPSKVGPITLSYSEYQSIDPNAPYCRKLVFTSEVSVHDIALSVSFSAPVKRVDSLVTFVYKGWQRIDEQDKAKVNIAMLGFNGDVLLPERPIVVVVCSDQPFTPTRLERRNVVETVTSIGGATDREGSGRSTIVRRNKSVPI